MKPLRLYSFVPAIISKAMILLAFVLTSSMVYSQIALRGTATTAISTSASVTVTKPTGVIAGDLLIANVSNYYRSYFGLCGHQ